MEGDRGHAGVVDEPLRQLHAAAVAGLAAGPELDGDRPRAALRRGPGERDRLRGVVEQRGAGAGLAHLAHRAAHVEVDQVGSRVGGDRGRLAHDVGVVAEQLDRHRVLVRVDAQELAHVCARRRTRARSSTPSPNDQAGAVAAWPAAARTSCRCRRAARARAGSELRAAERPGSARLVIVRVERSREQAPQVGRRPGRACRQVTDRDATRQLRRSSRSRSRSASNAARCRAKARPSSSITRRSRRHTASTSKALQRHVDLGRPSPDRSTSVDEHLLELAPRDGRARPARAERRAPPGCRRG